MKQTDRTLIKILFIVSSTVALSACERDMTDLVNTINQIKQQPAGRIADIPEFIPYQNFEYTAQDLRDPFVLSNTDVLEETQQVNNENSTGPKPDLDRVKEALEEFPLDTLRFKGTVTTKDGTKWALIFAPDNTIHRVIEGYHLGQNYGRIYQINDEKISLTEIIPDGLGNYIEREAALALIN